MNRFPATKGLGAVPAALILLRLLLVPATALTTFAVGCQRGKPAPAENGTATSATSTATGAHANRRHAARPPSKGTIPDFDLPLLAADAHKTISHDDLGGRPTLLYFWATWCAGCIIQSPAVAETATHFSDRPVNILGINVDDTQQIAKKAAKQAAYPFQSVFDEKNHLRRRLAVTHFPSVFIFDAAGRKLYSANRVVAASKLKQVLTQGLQCGRQGCSETTQ